MNKIPVSLLVYTILSGLSAGAYIFMNLGVLLSAQMDLFAVEKAITFMCLIVMCLSLLASATHLGKPLRFLNALANPKSMIAQEGYWAPLFTLVLFLTSVKLFTGSEPWIWLRVIGVIVGIILLFVTALVYVKPKGIPAWNNANTIFSFLFGTALMGVVVCLAFLSINTQSDALTNSFMSIAIALLCLQILASIATEIQISSCTAGLSIPRLVSMNVLRWLIGLICPLIVFVMAYTGAVSYQEACWIGLIAVLIGEIISRAIFFMRGVHLKNISYMW